MTLTALAGFRIHPPLKELKDPYSRTAARRDSSSCALFFGTCLARLFGDALHDLRGSWIFPQFHQCMRGAKDSERFQRIACAPLREGWRMRRLSILKWYRILRVHHKWTIFQAIRYALRLAR